MQAEAIKSGPLKDMGSPFKALSDNEREVMQAMVNDYYARFVDVVKTRRKISDEATLKLVTDGRVFTGTRAAELGLVDRTGRLEDAFAHFLGVTRATVHGDLQLARRQLGHDWNVENC